MSEIHHYSCIQCVSESVVGRDIGSHTCGIVQAAEIAM